MIRTVIADDHAIFRQGLASLLCTIPQIELTGQAGTGVEAICLIREQKPDLAILDNRMPGLSGIAAVEQLATMEDRPRLIILTMFTEVCLVSQALNAGADGFVIKESAFDELARAIEDVMQGRRFVSPALAAKMVQDPVKDQTVSLTGRETEILKLVASGNSNRAIAEMLCISIKTVDTHRTRLMAKLNVHTTAQLVRWAVKTGLIEP